MRKSGFRKQSIDEVREKQAAKRLKAASKPRKAPRTRLGLKKVSKRTTAPKKAKLPSVKTMRNKCDALLTPIIKKMYPYCIFTGEETQVAHHAIKKSTSSALRYYLPNLIPLTHKAHMRLHADEILWTGKLIELKGLEWWQDLMAKKEVYTKCDVHHYIAEYARLKELYESL